MKFIRPTVSVSADAEHPVRGGGSALHMLACVDSIFLSFREMALQEIYTQGTSGKYTLCPNLQKDYRIFLQKFTIFAV